jgi:outer membrane receptor protein involved in Fe transport
MLNIRSAFLALAVVSFGAWAQEGTSPAAPPANAPAEAKPAEAAPAAPAAPGTNAAKPKKPGEEEYVEEIVVTGSRIPRVELTTAAPVTVLNRTQIESSGRPSIGDILQSIPEQSNAINTQFNNGGDGATRINLRGLGTARTLVLVNGRRFVAGGTGADASVDLNSIPTSAIQRIEILKDGASAVYGSDAISGVVNIITRKDFSGTEISAFSGVSNYGDGVLVDLGATTGQVTDRGNILFSGGFIKQQPVWSGPTATNGNSPGRPFSQYQWGLDIRSGELFTIGSSNIPQSRMYPDAAANAGNAAWLALRTKYPKTKSFTLDVDPAMSGTTATGGWRPFNGSGVSDAGGDLYNFQPENYLVTPQQRGHLFAVGEYKFSPDVRGYFEASFTNRVSEQKLAPEPLIIGTAIGGEDVYIDKNNPYNPFGVDFLRYRRRLVEVGNRVFREDINTFRLVSGVNGNLPILSNWTWDVSLNLGRNDATYLKRGTVQLSALQNALGPGFYDMASGSYKCGVPGAEIAGCVPINLFGGAAAKSITPDMAKYLSFDGTSLGFNQQLIASANIAGELFRITPTAHLSGVAVGYEFRKESGGFIPDPLTAKGDTSGNKGEATQGAFSVNEGYVELSLPILGQFGEQTQGGKDLLELNAAARFVDYSTFGSNISYKVGARLSPVQDITLRGTYSTAFRAPSIGELYSGQSDDFPAVTDPCSAPAAGASRDPGVSGGTPAEQQAYNLNQACLATSFTTPDGQVHPVSPVPVDFFDDSKQLRSRVGGNPDLNPETANIFTAGLVVEPRFLKDFSVTVDYYNIAVLNSITTIGAAQILASCYPTDPVKAQYCDKVSRDPASHTIQSIFNPLANVGGDFTNGVDVGARFEPETPAGRFLFDADVSWLGLFDSLLAGTKQTAFGVGTLIEGKGNYDLAVHPDWVGNAGITWAMDPLRVGVRGRFVGPFKECGDSDGFAAGGGGVCHQDDTTLPPPYSRIVQPYMTVDANVAWTLNSGLGASTISAGVNNLMNVEPARVYNGFAANSDTGAYDYMMRYFYARITHKF